MARRRLGEDLRRDTVMSSAQSTRQFLQAQLRHEQREVFVVLYLDNQHQLLLYEPLFMEPLTAPPFTPAK
ncbi:MAG: DNA repair protein RadC [Bacteroidia bacterium]|jgi:DNA repair protein RadC